MPFVKCLIKLSSRHCAWGFHTRLQSKVPLCVCVYVSVYGLRFHFPVCVSVLILDSRQKKAEELRRLTDKSASMSEEQLTELRAEIKVHLWNRTKHEGCAQVSSKIPSLFHWVRGLGIMWAGASGRVQLLWMISPPCSTLWASENTTRTSGRPCDSPLTLSRWRRASVALVQVRFLRQKP